MQPQMHLAYGTKLLASARAKTSVVVAAALMLLLGHATRPPRPATAPLDTPVERTAPLLEAEVERREAITVNERARDLANQVVGYAVSVPPPAPEPRRTHPDAAARAITNLGGIAVAIPGNRLLTHVSALGGYDRVALGGPNGSAIDATLVAVDRETGLAVLVPDTSPSVPAAPLAERPPAVGTSATAAGRAIGGAVIAPVTLAVEDAPGYRLAGADTLPPGTPLYNDAGELLAMVGVPPLAFPVREALARIAVQSDEGRPIPTTIGAWFQDNAPEFAPWFGEGGVLVARVAPGGPAARGGLEPGDVVLAIDGEQVHTIPEVRRRTATSRPGDAAVVRVRRDHHEIELELAPESLYRPVGGETPDQVTPGARVEALPSANLTRRLGLHPGARLLLIDGKPARTTGQLERTRRPSLLYLEDAGERYFVVLSPAAEAR